MTNEGPPCSHDLGSDCFEAFPEWARKAFAYRLLLLLTPKPLTKRLHRKLFRFILPPGIEIPPGVELPPGVVVPPGVDPPTTYEPGDPVPPGVTVPIGTVFPPGWTPEDPPPPGVVVPPGVVIPPGWTPPGPLPPGTIPPGKLPPGQDQTGTTPPLYIPPFTPGPVSTRPPGGPGGVSYYLYDSFDTIDPSLWNDASQGAGSISIDAGRLKCLAPGGGDVAGVNWMTQDPNLPAAFEWGFDMNHQVGTGQILCSLRTGVHWIYLIFTPPTTLQYLKLGCVPSSNTIDTITGTTDSWRVIYNGTTITVYRGAALIMNGVSICANVALKGTRFMTLSDGNTTYFDNYYILET